MTNPNDIIDAYDELVRLVKTLGADIVQQLLERAAGRPPVTDTAPLATVTEIDKLSPPAQRASETGGCPWCGLDIGKNTMFRHLNNAHRDDLEQLYVEDGIKGLQDTFGVPYGTAWNWARKLDGEAA